MRNHSDSHLIARYEHFIWLFLLLLLAVMMVRWSLLPGVGPAGADEPMRYDVCKWLYEHPWQLPRGDDPKLVNPTWGISYAFYPYLSYMISALLMHAASLYSTSEAVLLYAARQADVLFILAAAFFTLRAGKYLFGSEKGLLFSILVLFTPEFHYLGTYVNNDSLALMSAAILLYAWSRALEEGWTAGNSAVLGIGLGLCFLSYYNAYGWILCSFFFFVLTILLDPEQPMAQRIRLLLRRGISILAITLGISGWFFVRNFIIYDGDFLGRSASAASALKYAKEGYRPGEHWTPSASSWSLKQFLIYQDPGWPHNWLIMSLLTFFGTFGVFNIYMEEGVSKVYFFFIWTGIALMFLLHRSRERKERILLSCLAGTMGIPILLFAFYAYFEDLQAQGRYYIPAIYAMMSFALTGWEELSGRFIRSGRVRGALRIAVGALYILAAVLNYLMIVLPVYRP